MSLPPELVQLIDSYRDKRLVEYWQIKWYYSAGHYRIRPYTFFWYQSRPLFRYDNRRWYQRRCIQIEPGLTIGYNYGLILVRV